MTTHRPVRALACAGGVLIATTAATPADARSWIDQLPDSRVKHLRAATSHPTPSAPKLSRRAKLTKHGRAIAPAGAPPAVRRIIRAGNRIARKPYLWGGGHGSWVAAGYDCSGSVSYALRGGGLLRKAMASGGLMSYGRPGKGKWVTVYAHGGHVYMVVAGLRFDTTAFKQGGSRWTRDLRGGGGGFVVRHPRGL